MGLTERRAILDKAIADHRGRIANTAGDSVLAEFGSAVATQIATHRRGGPLPERYKRRNGPRVGATGVTLGQTRFGEDRVQPIGVGRIRRP
jgi:adenylate cyclase